MSHRAKPEALAPRGVDRGSPGPNALAANRSATPKSARIAPTQVTAKCRHKLDPGGYDWRQFPGILWAICEDLHTRSHPAT
jgi:hypothetical protein